MSEEFRRVTLAVAQSKSVYERVQAVQALLADARRAALEEALGYADHEMREADRASELADRHNDSIEFKYLRGKVTAARCIKDRIRALLDDAGKEKGAPSLTQERLPITGPEDQHQRREASLDHGDEKSKP